VFGFGVIVACIVGMVILYQTLATQILRYLPQYAVLKAMGYTNLYLGDVVLRVAGLMSVIAFVPASLCAVATYAIIQSATLLPIEMTLSRLVSVFAITLFMSASSALLSIRVVRRADPVELL
jgi:putative ABC transport system permease protein